MLYIIYNGSFSIVTTQPQVGSMYGSLAMCLSCPGECAYAVFGSVGEEDGLVGLLAAMK